jgi:hypothetical protein
LKVLPVLTTLSASERPKQASCALGHSISTTLTPAMLDCRPRPLGDLHRLVSRALPRLGLTLAFAMSLAACGQPVSSTQGCDAGQANSGSQRVLVSFRQPTSGNAPSVIAQLQDRSGACVRWLSSVSPTLHVYAVSGSLDLPGLRARWLPWQAVQAVEADALVKRQ